MEQLQDRQFLVVLLILRQEKSGAMTDRYLKWGLFILWPAIACLLMCAVAMMCAFAWLLIPFGVPTKDGNTWTLKFPWSKD